MRRLRSVIPIKNEDMDMPYPSEYQRSQDVFSEFLTDVRDNAQMRSSHMAYTMTQGVLQAMRRRLTLEDSIRFSNILPAAIRSLFVADWDPSEERVSCFDKQSIVDEVKLLRPLHNFTSETATPVEDVVKALKKHVDEQKLSDLLKTFPQGATEFFKV